MSRYGRYDELAIEASVYTGLSWVHVPGEAC